jgi:GT2 family glycosyltransferase
MIDLSIIIVNWNSAEYTLSCVKSIYEQTSDLKFEIIIIDNASFDECEELIKAKYPKVIFIQSKYNLGFAAANNLCAEKAIGRVLLFLNPDTEVQNRAIERLFQALENLPDAGVIGCRLINSDGTIQNSCVQRLPRIINQILDANILRKMFPSVNIWGYKKSFEKYIEPVEVEAISGACMMIRRSAFELVKRFSIEYFMYAEDMDLCFKTRSVQLRNYFCGKSIIVHHGGGSSKNSFSKFATVMILESIYRFFQKTKGKNYSRLYRFMITIMAMMRLIFIILGFPIMFIYGENGSWKSALLKWIATLRWGFGIEKWARIYGSNN